ncbi:hypothetical protein [Aestuariispira insulae]|uniref:MORN repeat protein n=1 Tax=Aestuariispira insulae TaxID=1461337 RepID=A0A3D9HVQ2_9PROT|nr:hypothetical protein [Aestuariispira insulae]RED53572.1 hypothetical protein DFP90_101363 [Aestuariispira insulae]
MTRILCGKAGALLGAVLFLGGCQALDLGGEPGPYDGRWVGRFTLSIGEKRCLRRINMSAEVVNGRMSGSVEEGKSIIRYSGRVDDDGNLVRGQFIQREYGNEGVMEGTFTQINGSGTWQNKRCQGKWTLRRVSTGQS